MKAFFAILKRDLRLSLGAGGIGLPIAFFLLVATLYPFAVGPDGALLARTGGGVIWVAALLAALLPIDRLIAPDAESGVLDQYAVRGIGEEAVATAKIAAHWLGFGPPLMLAALPLAGLLWLNWKGAHRIAPALLLGTIMWFLVLKSGVHATLAGVVTAFTIPLTDKYGKSPLHSLEHGLSPYVLYMIVPIFAFANAGVVLTGLSLSDLFAPLPLGIALGLIIGKQIGVFGMTWAMVKLGFARLPHGASWMHIYGIACLAGIGFTMSLFIGSLSFADAAQMNAVRLGVLSGSLVSAILGYGVLLLAARREAAPADA